MLAQWQAEDAARRLWQSQFAAQVFDMKGAQQQGSVCTPACARFEEVYVYEIPSKFALIKYVLECASDVGCCMKPAKTIGDSQKKRYVFDCACLRVLWCGHSVCLGMVVFFTVGSTSP